MHSTALMGLEKGENTVDVCCNGYREKKTIKAQGNTPWTMCMITWHYREAGGVFYLFNTSK